MELWARKAIACCEFSELFYRSLEVKIVESGADDGGLACEVSEGSKDYWDVCVEHLWCLVSWS